MLSTVSAVIRSYSASSSALWIGCSVCSPADAYNLHAFGRCTCIDRFDAPDPRADPDSDRYLLEQSGHFASLSNLNFSEGSSCSPLGSENWPWFYTAQPTMLYILSYTQFCTCTCILILLFLTNAIAPNCILFSLNRWAHGTPFHEPVRQLVLLLMPDFVVALIRQGPFWWAE